MDALLLILLSLSLISAICVGTEERANEGGFITALVVFVIFSIIVWAGSGSMFAKEVSSEYLDTRIIKIEGGFMAISKDGRKTMRYLGYDDCKRLEDGAEIQISKKEYKTNWGKDRTEFNFEFK